MFSPGPLFFFELTRAARKRKLATWRCLYILGLLGVVAIIYLAALDGNARTFWDYLTMSQMPPRRAAGIAAAFAIVFLILQWMVAAGGTAANTQHCFSEERERQSLPFLLLTPLSDGEVVAGKVLAGLAVISMFLLAGLPVLALMQFLGGVDPRYLLMGYAVTFCTMLSIAGVGARASLYAPSNRIAQQRTAQAVFGYIVVSSSLWFLPMMPLNLGGRLLFSVDGWPVYTEDLIDLVNLGNPISSSLRIIFLCERGATLDDVLPLRTLAYCLIHLAIATGLLTWTARNLRHVAGEIGDGVAPPAPKKRGIRAEASDKPPVGDLPVYWRELYCQRVATGPTSLKLRAMAYVIGLTIPLLFPLMIGWRNPRDMVESSAVFTRGIVSVVVCAGWVHLMVRSAQSIWLDVKKGTLAEILLTDLTPGDILAQKGQAVLVSLRWLALWVLVAYLVGVLYGAISPLSLPLVVLSITVYAAFTLALGLWCAACFLHAKVPVAFGLLTCLGTGALPWVALGLVNAFVRVPNSLTEQIVMFLAGWSPETQIGMLAFHFDDLGRLFSSNHGGLFVVGTVSSLTLHSLAALFLWRRAKQQVEVTLRRV